MLTNLQTTATKKKINNYTVINEQLLLEWISSAIKFFWIMKKKSSPLHYNMDIPDGVKKTDVGCVLSLIWSPTFLGEVTSHLLLCSFPYLSTSLDRKQFVTRLSSAYLKQCYLIPLFYSLLCHILCGTLDLIICHQDSSSTGDLRLVNSIFNY